SAIGAWMSGSGGVAGSGAGCAGVSGAGVDGSASPGAGGSVTGVGGGLGTGVTGATGDAVSGGGDEVGSGTAAAASAGVLGGAVERAERVLGGKGIGVAGFAHGPRHCSTSRRLRRNDARSRLTGISSLIESCSRVKAP